MQKHPAQMQPRQFVPAAFVMGLTVLLAGALWLAPARLLLLSVGVLYLAVATLAAFRVSSGQPRLIPRVVFVFGVLHLSYGSGFLRGLVRFWDRWGSDPKTAIPNLEPLH